MPAPRQVPKPHYAPSTNPAAAQVVRRTGVPAAITSETFQTAQITGGGPVGYITVQSGGTPLPAEQVLNFIGSSFFTITDNPGVATNVQLNIGALDGPGGAGGSLPLFVNNLAFDASQSGPEISVSTTSATNAQDLSLVGGNSSASNGVPGRHRFRQQDGPAGAVSAGFQFEQGTGAGSIYAKISVVDGSKSQARFHLINPAQLATLDGTNFALECQSGILHLNGPSNQIWVMHAGQLTNGTVIFDTAGTQFNSSSTATTFAGGVGVIGETEANTPPSGTPVGGVVRWVQGGAAKVKGTSGTVTTYGPAEPHCPVCGSDFVTEHESPKYGYLSVCLKCLADELGERAWIAREKRAV